MSFFVKMPVTVTVKFSPFSGRYGWLTTMGIDICLLYTSKATIGSTKTVDGVTYALDGWYPENAKGGAYGLSLIHICSRIIHTGHSSRLDTLNGLAAGLKMIKAMGRCV